MLDTDAGARSLTAADFTPAQADALHGRAPVGRRAGRSRQVRPVQGRHGEMRTEITEVRTEIANLDTRLSGRLAAA